MIKRAALSDRPLLVMAPIRKKSERPLRQALVYVVSLVTGVRRQRFLDLRFHGFHVEARALLHRRKLD